MDVAAIQPGKDFRKAIDQSVSNCSVLLALIGREWLETKNSDGERRLDNPNDFVRIELASALRRDIPVVPVLVRGARMPRAEQLPDDLKELHYRNAVELTHARWKSDVLILVNALRPYMDAPTETAPAHVSKVASPPVAPTAKQPAAPPSGQATVNTAAGIERFGVQTIDRITRELAAYIGPISETVVKRAARRCTSLEELCNTVAQEIEGDGNRVRFLKACRS